MFINLVTAKYQVFLIKFLSGENTWSLQIKIHQFRKDLEE